MMKSEQFDSGMNDTPEKVVYTRELLTVKLNIQKEVMALFCEGDIHNQERVSNWIDEYSSVFRLLFETRVREGGEAFLRECEEDPKKIAQEIALQMSAAEML